MKIITIEEHLGGVPISQAIAKYAMQDADYFGVAHGPGRPYDADPELYGDLDKRRIADMDANGIDIQVLSCPVKAQLLPENEASAIVRESNDYIANVVAKHPDRYGAFALLPWSVPQEAVKEIERVKKLGFQGILLAGRASAGPEFLDDKRYLPILEAAEACHMPIYVHPGAPLKDVQKPYYGGLGDELSARLSLHGWGWHNEAGIQVLRTILAGRFEQFPDLQLIAGHWGEMVPFFLSRLDQSIPPMVTKLEKTVTEYFKENVYITPSGIFDYPQLKFCVEVVGADRIIHSVDCPFVSNEGAKPFIENAPISEEEKEKIAHLNAERLFDWKNV